MGAEGGVACACYSWCTVAWTRLNFAPSAIGGDKTGVQDVSEQPNNRRNFDGTSHKRHAEFRVLLPPSVLGATENLHTAPL